MGTNQYTYAVGATQIIIGPSATITVAASEKQSKWLFKKFSGGSLAVVNGASQVASSGYMLGNSEAISFEGPAKFYLAASGATVTVHFMQSFTAGSSI